MKTAAECLILAERMEARARESPDEDSRRSYLAMAADWRTMALFMPDRSANPPA